MLDHASLIDAAPTARADAEPQHGLLLYPEFTDSSFWS